MKFNEWLLTSLNYWLHLTTHSSYRPFWAQDISRLFRGLSPIGWDMMCRCWKVLPLLSVAIERSSDTWTLHQHHQTTPSISQPGSKSCFIWSAWFPQSVLDGTFHVPEVWKHKKERGLKALTEPLGMLWPWYYARVTNLMPIIIRRLHRVQLFTAFGWKSGVEDVNKSPILWGRRFVSTHAYV